MARSGGVVVEVPGPRSRVVPVLSTYHGRLRASGAFAGDNYLIGGLDASRHNFTTPLISSLAGGADLPRLSTSRLRATWLSATAEIIGLRAFMDAAGVVCSQRLGDLVAHLEAPTEARAVALLGARR